MSSYDNVQTQEIFLCFVLNYFLTSGENLFPKSCRCPLRFSIADLGSYSPLNQPHEREKV